MKVLFHSETIIWIQLEKRKGLIFIKLALKICFTHHTHTHTEKKIWLLNQLNIRIDICTFYYKFKINSRQNKTKQKNTYWEGETTTTKKLIKISNWLRVRWMLDTPHFEYMMWSNMHVMDDICNVKKKR